MVTQIRWAVLYGLFAAVILTLLAGIHYTRQKQTLQDQKDDSLRAIAGILDVSIPAKGASPLSIKKRMEDILEDHPNLELKSAMIKIYDASQAALFSSSITKEDWLQMTEPMWKTALADGVAFSTLPPHHNRGSIRTIVVPVFREGDSFYVIQLGSSMRDIETAMQGLLFLNFWLIPGAALLFGIGGAGITKRVLKPLDRVAATACEVNAENLSRCVLDERADKEIRGLTEAFNQMMDRLETSFHQMRDFSNNVSHELRMLLSILRGETELCLLQNRSVEEYRKTLENNLEEMLRMEEVIEKLLFLSKADHGEMELHHIEFDLFFVIKEVISEVELTAKGKKIAVHLRAGGSTLIHGDPILMRGAILNLVQNAITYTPAGGEVSLFIEKERNEARVSVTDTGLGIPGNEIPHIFERFYRADQSYLQSRGSGLGLSIVKWIVELHRGRITVDSVVGKGSRFTMILPLPAS
jgi:heavy metal sensor kinase